MHASVPLSCCSGYAAVGCSNCDSCGFIIYGRVPVHSNVPELCERVQVNLRASSLFSPYSRAALKDTKIARICARSANDQQRAPCDMTDVMPLCVVTAVVRRWSHEPSPSGDLKLFVVVDLYISCFITSQSLLRLRLM